MVKTCEKCSGEGIISVQDPSDAYGIMTHTVCEPCNGTGLDYDRDWASPFWVILLIPNFLLFF